MRIVKLAFLAVAVLAIASPVFACRLCEYDAGGNGFCGVTQMETFGCRFLTADTCEETGIYCPGSVQVEALHVASVEVTHGVSLAQKPAVVKAEDASRPAPAVTHQSK